jgi:hypothetical protein
MILLDKKTEERLCFYNIFLYYSKQTFGKATLINTHYYFIIR